MNFFTLKGVIRLDKKIFPHTFSLEASYRGLDQGSRELPPCSSHQLPISALCDSLLSVPAVFSLFRRGFQLSYWVNRRVHLGKGGA